MKRIVAGITSLEQHLREVEERPETYRPPSCPECGLRSVWRHGHYLRKADLCGRGEENKNPVQILRFRCAGCGLTCSRLPECIAPRRWYNWARQEQCLNAASIPEHEAHCQEPARRTVQRWRQWLQAHTEVFRFTLTCRFAELGRAEDGPSFWRLVFDTLGLSRAMAWCERERVVP